eukprot:4089219-Lingulodinium_polyedra.AAC.1
MEDSTARNSDEREALVLKKAAFDAEVGQMSIRFCQGEQRLTQVWESVSQSEQRNAGEAATRR